MRRILSLLTVTVAFSLVTNQPAAAAPDQSICTDTVWSDIAGYSAESTDLDNAINNLRSKGFDARAVFIHDLGPGVDDVPEFERTVLRSTCPELFAGTDPKPDLLMLVVSDGDREAGVVFGGQASPFHSESRFSDTSDDYFRAGDYSGGLAAYFDVINRRIEGAQQSGQSEGQASDNGPSISRETVYAIVSVIATAVVVALLIVLIWITMNTVKAARKRRAEKALLVERLQKARTNYSNMVIGDGNPGNLDQTTTMTFLAYWIDKLPDDEDEVLREARYRYDQSVSECGDLLTRTEAIINSASNDDELADADAEMTAVESLIGKGISALHEAEEACRSLADRDAAFKQQQPQLVTSAAAVNSQLDELEQRGFKIAPYRTRLATLVDGLTVCQQRYDSGALISSYDRLGELSGAISTLAATAEELPERAGRIETHAAELKQLIEEMKPRQVDISNRMSAMQQNYHHNDVEDVLGTPHDASRLMESALISIEQALAASTMEQQAFDEADGMLNNAERDIESANDIINKAVAREKELALLPDRLQTSASELWQQVEELVSYIGGVPAGDISEDVQNESMRLYGDVGEFKRQISSGDKVSLLAAEQLLDKLDGHINNCFNHARSEHEAQEQLRREVREARQRAKQRLDSASNYRSYASDRYARADRYFDGVIAGMTLQQQLNHWNEAYDAADAAYDEGYSDYQDAHRPVRTTYSSSSSSFDFGGGSTGHSFSSSSFGGGGSSGHSW